MARARSASSLMCAILIRSSQRSRKATLTQLIDDGLVVRNDEVRFVFA